MLLRLLHYAGTRCKLTLAAGSWALTQQRNRNALVPLAAACELDRPLALQAALRAARRRRRRQLNVSTAAADHGRVLGAQATAWGSLTDYPLLQQVTRPQRPG
jgi:hypothetical protein